MTSKELAELKV
jgi:hypothetical protein